MKSMITFLSIAFLCLSCQKRAPMNLSLPPLEVLQKMESESRLQNQTQEDQSIKFRGVESGSIKFKALQGDIHFNLNELCPTDSPKSDVWVYSCLRFSSQEALTYFSQINLSEISLTPHFQDKNYWEYEIESYFYWPENKLLVPLAEITEREGKKSMTSLYRGEVGHGEVFLVLRLKKLVETQENSQLKIWTNKEPLDLTSFDFWWQEREKKLVKKEVLIDGSYQIENLKLGSVLELDLQAFKRVPTFFEKTSRVQVSVDVEDLPRQRNISNVSCEVFENYAGTPTESIQDLSRNWASLKLRLNINGKSYSLQELVAWGKASIVYGQGRFKVRLLIEDEAWTKNLSVYLDPPDKFFKTIGQIRFGKCLVRNAASYVVLQNLSSHQEEFFEQEFYQGTYIIK